MALTTSPKASMAHFEITNDEADSFAINRCVLAVVLERHEYVLETLEPLRDRGSCVGPAVAVREVDAVGERCQKCAWVQPPHAHDIHGSSQSRV